MTKASARHRAKVAARSLHARKVERVEQLKRERDAALRKVWRDYQERIADARRTVAA